MAFLVCYSRNPPFDHCKSEAIYLDQGFYELIWSVCRVAQPPYLILGKVACLRYKSPVLPVPLAELSTLDQELVRLGESSHEQIVDLRTTCWLAAAQGLALTVSGDMYPEL
jgi:hypothetical protein